MAEFATVKVEGLAQLEARLLELKTEIAVRVLARAALVAFEPVLEAAKAGVPTESGELREAIRITTRKPSSGDTVVVVGLRINPTTPLPGDESPARRWHFIEFGTAHVAAHPFLRPALDQNADRVLSLLKEELAAGIERAARRQGQAA